MQDLHQLRGQVGAASLARSLPVDEQWPVLRDRMMRVLIFLRGEKLPPEQFWKAQSTSPKVKLEKLQIKSQEAMFPRSPPSLPAPSSLQHIPLWTCQGKVWGGPSPGSNCHV